MEVTTARTLSGRALVVIGMATCLLVGAAAVVLGPALRQDVLDIATPRTLREPLATGEAGLGRWEAVARYDGSANCVELRYREEVFDRACDGSPSAAAVIDTSTTTLPGSAPIAYGVTAEGVDSVRLHVGGGRSVDVPVQAGELGFPVGFWAAELPPSAALERVTALDDGGGELGSARYSGSQN